MKLGFISIGTGGTKGHMSFATSVSNRLLNESKNECYVFSEEDYKNYSNIKNSKINYIRIKKQAHQRSSAGCIKYIYRKELLEKIKDLKIDTIIFSTFFDIKLIKALRELGIKVLLHTFLLRDTHLKLFNQNKFYDLFDKVLILNDLIKMPFEVENSITVAPIIDINNSSKRKIKNLKKILVTCGGGGRPSREKFFKQVIRIIKKNQDIEFTIIEASLKDKINMENVSVIPWNNNFQKLVNNYDLVICEAGYNTTVELLSSGKPAILIPGRRRIDNQELRALEYEKLGCGLSLSPEGDLSNILDMMKRMKRNSLILNKFSNKSKKVSKIIFDASIIGGKLINGEY